MSPGCPSRPSESHGHNNHHAFPTSAFHGLRRRELDPGGLFITALERAGLAWRVVRISPERQRQKAAPGIACFGKVLLPLATRVARKDADAFAGRIKAAVEAS
jgi:hypothetical protein